MQLGKSRTIAGGQRLARLAIFLVFLSGAIGITLASRSCKSTVMKIVMKQCSGAESRSRRDLSEFFGNIISPSSNHLTSNKSSASWLMDKLPAFLSPNLLELLLQHILHALKGSFNSILPFMNKNQNTTRVQRDTLPNSKGDDLGFDLTANEVEELYNEIFERLQRQPSTTPDEAKRLFLDIAARCCQNEDTCLREKIINCP